jgi:triacylglycerol esterase/lipase EstA (alpha/beta hydrolase family)
MTIFVAHSLGGLVVKQVQKLRTVLTRRQLIVEAYNNEEYTMIHKAIKGVFFLGTPHRGSDLAGMLNLVLMASFSSSTFVRQLNPNGDTIAVINDSFSHRVEPLQLISFFETENTRLQWVEAVKKFLLIVVASHRKAYRS